MTFFDLAVPYQPSDETGKQPIVPTAHEKKLLEAQIDARVKLGYTVIAINHIVKGKFQQPVEGYALTPREGVIFLRRLTIIIDENNEKDFALTTPNTSLFASYDIISLLPTTESSFSGACLTHSAPGSLTSHIITLDLASHPRMSFYFKHSLIRTAIRNGVVFEIPYAPVISPNSEYRRRTWWANAMELCRMTNGKNIIFGSGTKVISDLRAPLDVANLGTLLSLSQDVALNALTKTPKALILRAQTRKTYRAMVSAPKIVYPSGWPSEGVDAVAAAAESEGDVAQLSVPSKRAAAEAVDTIPSSTRQGKRRKKKKNEEASLD